MSKNITITGQRGGSGKSITAVNLAASLALMEKRTLLLDVDPQKSATDWSGIKDKTDVRDISSVLGGLAPISEAILNTELNFLDVLPSGFELFKAEAKFRKNAENIKLLRLILEEVGSDYDYIIIDPPSSYGFLSLMGLAAADWLLVSMSLPNGSFDDLHCLLQVVKDLKSSHKLPLKIAGILFNQCRSKKELDAFLEKQSLTDAKGLVFDNFIPDDEFIRKAIDMKIPAALNNVKNPGAAAFLNFALEIDSFLR
jgi:chromosome partitioning protein